MAEQLREQHGFYFDEEKRIPRRRSATPDDLAERQTHTGSAPTRSRQTEEDDNVSTSYPMKPMVRRFDRIPLTTQREYMIPLDNGTAIYVTERKLATMGRDYKEAAQEVTPGTIAQKQKQKHQPQGNTNRAAPPDVIEVPPSRTTQAQPDRYYPTIGQRVRGWTGRGLIVLGIGLMIMIVGYILLNIVGNWWQTTQDDWHYGRPRTYQTDFNVGHGTASNPDSHFIAINLNKKIEVIEIPGNDPAKSQIYIGPTLIGPGEELTPVTLSFEDVNGDGHPDLVIHVADSKFIFLNQKVNGVWKFVPAPNQ